MIVTNSFLFLHLHKTGGQFIRNIILENFAEAQEIGYHYPLNMCPAQYRDLPIIIFIRNPWDWYVSWYAFNASNPAMNPLFRVFSDEGRLNFSETVTRMLCISEASNEIQKLRERLKSQLPENIAGNRQSGITKSCIDTIGDPDTGYYSWLFQRMIGDQNTRERLLVGRFENLRQDLLQMLRQLDINISQKMQHDIQHSPKINSSNHADFITFYDNKLADLVARKERRVIDKYEFRCDKQID